MIIKEEIAKEIESKFLSAKDLTKITYRKGLAVYGTFLVYEDYPQLRSLHKFRFAPSVEAREFESVSSKVGEKNFIFSIIIDCDEVEKVEFVQS